MITMTIIAIIIMIIVLLLLLLFITISNIIIKLSIYLHYLSFHIHNKYYKYEDEVMKKICTV